MGTKPKGNMHGLKTKAGMLLSGFIKEIAKEQTEFVKDDDGDDRMVTKAESLARKIWKLALGYEETVKLADGTEKIKPHGPNSTYVGIVLDRMEGRAPLLAGDKDGRIPIADRITQEGKNRVNSVITNKKK